MATNHPDLGRRAKYKDSTPAITGTITAVTCAHTPSSLSAFKIYTVSVDPECYGLCASYAGWKDLSETWTEWNAELV